MKLKIQGNEAIIEGEDGFASSLVRGCKGKVKINTPFGRREVKLVDRFQTNNRLPFTVYRLPFIVKTLTDNG